MVREAEGREREEGTSVQQGRRRAAWVRAFCEWVACIWVRGVSWWRRGTAGPPEEVQGRSQRTIEGARAALTRCLTAAIDQLPAADGPADVVAGEAAAAAAARLRAVRAPRTEARGRGPLSQLLRFLEANASLARDVDALTDDVWDVVVEAYLTARVGPTVGHPWTRPGGWGAVTPATAGADQRAAVATLRRLGYIGGGLRRVAAAREALGCGEKDEVRHAEPVFAWEVCRGVRSVRPGNLWEQAAVALVALGAICAGRLGSVTGFQLESAVLTTQDDVLVLRARQRAKTKRVRAATRQRRAPQPMAIQHWLIREAVVPYVRTLRALGCHGSQLLFPSLVRERFARSRSANGRVVDGLWLEPVRQWSSRQVAEAMQFVAGRGTFQGLRVGNNIELRRRREIGGAGPAAMMDRVADTTRRVLHGRTVRDLLGSEVAYHEVFLEDLCAATRGLGGLRIERLGGGLFVTATSGSCGERDDWSQHQRAFAPVSEPDCSEDEGSSEASDVEAAPAVTGAFRGGMTCGRCGVLVPAAAHGWMCDGHECPWGVCVPCHPGGARSPLWCPEHARGHEKG